MTRGPRFYTILEEPPLYIAGKPTIERVREHGVTAIACVAKRGTADEVVAAVSDYLYLPIPDGKNVMRDDFWRVANWVDARLRDGHTALIHCLAGRNRSVTVAGLIIRDRLSLTGDEVVRYLRRCRPNALHNSHFEEWLRSLPRGGGGA